MDLTIITEFLFNLMIVEDLVRPHFCPHIKTQHSLDTQDDGGGGGGLGRGGFTVTVMNHCNNVFS